MDVELLIISKYLNKNMITRDVKSFGRNSVLKFFERVTCQVLRNVHDL